jgi:predicted enzyme related to lactoylglutathione lyase
LLNSSPIIAFVPITDPARARTFYEQVLGLTFVGEDEFAMAFEAHGTALRLPKLQSVSPAPYTVLGWRVADIRSEMHTLAARGVVFERYEGMPQDADGVWSAPGGGLIAWFKDPDGNVLSLTQSDWG